MFIDCLSFQKVTEEISVPGVQGLWLIFLIISHHSKIVESFDLKRYLLTSNTEQLLLG
jgi:hypothetical protein